VVVRSVLRFHAAVAGMVILRKSLSLYTSTWVHPGRSRSSRARYCSTLVSCKG
jgi:hypothetical protein